MCGVAGGWREWWNDPDDHAELRARAEASKCRQTRRTEVLGVMWQGEIRAEQRRKRRGGKGCYPPRRSEPPTGRGKARHGRGVRTVSQTVAQDGEGAMSHPPSPDTRITTAPATR
jgi:hypothetical protein